MKSTREKVAIVPHVIMVKLDETEFLNLKKKLMQLIDKGYRYFICNLCSYTDLRILNLLLAWKKSCHLYIELIYCSDILGVDGSYLSILFSMSSKVTNLDEIYQMEEKSKSMKYIIENAKQFVI